MVISYLYYFPAFDQIIEGFCRVGRRGGGQAYGPSAVERKNILIIIFLSGSAVHKNLFYIRRSEDYAEIVRNNIFNR